MANNKYIFVMKSGGNETLTLAGSRLEVVYNKLGDPISRKTVHPIQIIFNNGIGETTNENAVELIQQHPQWGSQYFWHPAAKEGKSVGDEEAKKEALGAVKRKLKKREEAVLKARSGEVSRDRD